MRSRLKLRPFLMVFGLFLAIIILPLLLNMRTKSVDTKVSTAYTQGSFIKEIAPLAQKLSDSYGIKASIIIAHASLSSDYGSNLLAARYNNYTGTVAQVGQPKIALKTQSYENGQPLTIKQPYAVYTDWQDSLYDYVAEIKSGMWGKQLYNSLATAEDYVTAARALQKAGVRSDTNYADELISVIQQHNLTKYDK
ncbi:glycoside hydrolase family 73 protein [Streptococcus dentapri]|uniref:Glycoside hydrolase family 73 protein n=1 Tax=Streptococcus dentapri TaxID=573564 RepID=A0ABV8D1F0_9STRE